MKRALGILLCATAPLLLGLLPGCDDATGPLVRPQTLAGIVRDAAGDSIPGAEIGIVYGLPVTDEALVPPDLPAAPPPALRLEQNFPNPFAATTAFLLGGAVNGGRIITDWPGLRPGDLLDPVASREFSLKAHSKSILGVL